MLKIRGIWLCHMSRWDQYMLRPRIWMETSRSGTVPHIGPYNTPSSMTKLFSQCASFDASQAAIYSDSIVDWATTDCLPLLQLITPPFNINTTPSRILSHRDQYQDWHRRKLLRRALLHILHRQEPDP